MAKSITLIYNFISRRWVLLSLLTIVCIAFALRVVLPMRTVFGSGYVNYLEGDCFSRMYYAKQIMGMPIGEGLMYAVPRGLLFPLLIAMLGYIIPVEYVGAWLPPVVAMGVIVIVYLIGSEIFNSVVGLLAALFVAVIPSEFYHRSLLGYPDHHVMEVLLMVLAVWFIIKVIKGSSIFNRYSIGLGVVTLLFLANWTGGVLLLGIIGIAFLITIRRRVAWGFAVAGIAGTAIYLGLGGFPRYFWWLPGEAANAAITEAHAAGMSSEMLYTMFQPMAERTTSELMPLLAPAGTFHIGVLATNLHLFFITFLVGITFLWLWRKDKANLFMIIFSVVVLALTLNQRRFLYYFTVPVGLLSAWGVYELGQLVKQHSYTVICLITLLLVLVSMPVLSVIGIAQAYAMPPEWYDALVWLRDEPSNGGMVTAWSDYGHWIQYETGKEPNYLNGPGGIGVAKLFLTEDDTEAQGLLKELDTQYLVIDEATMGYKAYALEIVAADGSKETDNSLGNRLLDGASVPYLQLAYESTSIKIYEHITD